MKTILHFIFICFLLFEFGCKKIGDTVSTQTIHGQVYNLCTDSGMANITVYLSTSGQAINPATTLSTVSDANGNFSFVNAQIHSSSDYDYTLYIPSASGIGGYGKPGFDAGEWGINKSKLTIKYTLGVVPHFRKWQLYAPNILFTSNDTFILTLQQRIYHKYFPNGNWQSVSNCSPCAITNPSHDIGDLGNYWAGTWKVTLDRTKNGVHTIQTDSFYVGYGVTQTDTLHW